MSEVSRALSWTRNPKLPLSMRKKLGKRIAPPPGMEFSIPLFGKTYYGVTGNLIDDRAYVYGIREAATIRYLRSVLKAQNAEGRGSLYFDIGTNTGMHLLACADVCDHAYGFEPFGAVRVQANNIMARNHLERVKIFPFGLSDQDAKLPFIAGLESNHGLGRFTQSDEDAATDVLTVRRGDDVISQLGHAPSLIKIDVEGHEAHVLRGLSETIAKHAPVIVFEYSPENRTDFDTLEKRAALFGSGYQFFGIKRSREHPVLKPFNPARRYENVVALPSPEL